MPVACPGNSPETTSFLRRADADPVLRQSLGTGMASESSLRWSPSHHPARASASESAIGAGSDPADATGRLPGRSTDAASEHAAEWRGYCTLNHPCRYHTGTSFRAAGRADTSLRLQRSRRTGATVRAERLAAATGTELRVVPGPRTPDHVVKSVEERYRQAPERIDRRPLSTVLEESGRLVVTADSASLLADAWRTGKPTWLYPLPVRLPPVQRLKIMADRITPELRHMLIRRGWLAGGTDFTRWHRALVQQGLVRPLTEQGLQEPDWRMPFPAPDEELRVCRDRVLALVANSAPASDRVER